MGADLLQPRQKRLDARQVFRQRQRIPRAQAEERKKVHVEGVIVGLLGGCGIELRQKVTPYLQALMAKGVLALPAGLTVLRFLPPLVIEQSDLARVVQAVGEVLNQQVEEK